MDVQASGCQVVFELRMRLANVKPGMITEHIAVFAGSKQSSQPDLTVITRKFWEVVSLKD